MGAHYLAFVKTFMAAAALVGASVLASALATYAVLVEARVLGQRVKTLCPNIAQYM